MTNDEKFDLDDAVVVNHVKSGTKEWDDLVSSILEENREALDILAR